MLVLERRIDEAIVIGGNIRVMIVAIRDERVRLGITAPKDVPVHREEVQKEIEQQQQQQRGQQDDR